MSWYHGDTRTDGEKDDEAIVEMLIILFLLLPVLLISCVGGR
jgi:nitrate reductase NapE component